ncbi:DUF7659 family protein [Aliarcobacter butzleri]
MKYLSDYTTNPQTDAFKKHGAFFAFSASQFNENKIEGVKYADCGHGLICPKENVKALLKELDEINQNGIKQDIEENGIEKIIKRELGNYECYYTGEIDDAVEALEDYGITQEQILKVFQGGSL